VWKEKGDRALSHFSLPRLGCANGAARAHARLDTHNGPSPGRPSTGGLALRPHGGQPGARVGEREIKGWEGETAGRLSGGRRTVSPVAALSRSSPLLSSCTLQATARALIASHRDITAAAAGREAELEGLRRELAAAQAGAAAAHAGRRRHRSTSSSGVTATSSDSGSEEGTTSSSSSSEEDDHSSDSDTAAECVFGKKKETRTNRHPPTQLANPGANVSPFTHTHTHTHTHTGSPPSAAAWPTPSNAWSRKPPPGPLRRRQPVTRGWKPTERLLLLLLLLLRRRRPLILAARSRPPPLLAAVSGAARAAGTMTTLPTPPSPPRSAPWPTRWPA